jgi:hypothetical protein
MVYPAFGAMAKDWLAPLLTATAPEGLMVPLAPALAVMVKVVGALGFTVMVRVAELEAAWVSVAVNVAV